MIPDLDDLCDLDLPDVPVAAARRGYRAALLQVALALVVVFGLLVGGAGLGGSTLLDLDAWLAASRAQAVVDDTADLIAAIPFAELEVLDGQSIAETSTGGGTDYRVDLSVTRVERGLRVRATLIDNRTREAVREFVAWRGRS